MITPHQLQLLAHIIENMLIGLGPLPRQLRPSIITIRLRVSIRRLSHIVIAIDRRGEAAPVPNGARRARPPEPGLAGTIAHGARESLIEVAIPEMCRRRGGRARGLRHAARDARVVDDLGDQARPAALVARPQPAPRVGVEELVEPHVVLPVGIEIQGVVAVVDGAAAVIPAGEEVLDPVLELLGDEAEVHVFA